MAILGRKPACNLSVDSLGRDDGRLATGTTTMCYIMSEERQDTQHLFENISDSCEYYPTGNRCGHDPKNPKWYNIPTHFKKCPIFIQKTIDELKSAFFSPKKKLTNFQSNSGRQIRSEKRNIQLDIMLYFVRNMDWQYFRVGQLINGKWVDTKLSTIAYHLEITIDRLKRALKEIVAKGYLKVTRQWTKKEGRYNGLASIKEITPKIFSELGIAWEKVFRMKEWRKERRRKKELKEEKNSARILSDFIQSTLNTMSIKPKQIVEQIQKPIHTVKKIVKEVVKKPTFIPDNEQTIEVKRRRTQLAMDRYRDDPSRTLSQHMHDIILQGL